MEGLVGGDGKLMTGKVPRHEGRGTGGDEDVARSHLAARGEAHRVGVLHRGAFEDEFGARPFEVADIGLVEPVDLLVLVLDQGGPVEGDLVGGPAEADGDAHADQDLRHGRRQDHPPEDGPLGGPEVPRRPQVDGVDVSQGIAVPVELLPPVQLTVVPRMLMLTYAFAVALAGFSGVMAAPIYQVSPFMGNNLIIVVFAVVVIGGMGSILGSIVTGFGLGVIEGLTKVFYPEGASVVIFIVMILMLAVRPNGLFGRSQ